MFSLPSCSTTFLQTKGSENNPANILHIGELISCAYRAAQKEINKDNAPEPYPRYIDQLLADGRLNIGLGIGTQDLGKINLPDSKNKHFSHEEYIINGKKILVEGRFILSKVEFQRSLGECEIIFITSHSRFGAGPVFLNDGKAKPFRMQKTEDYEIIMPESEVCEYPGTVKRTFRNPLKKKAYVVFEPDNRDLEKAIPLAGYQLLVLSTCTSKKHFLDEIIAFRGNYPTTAIFTTRACCMDTSMRLFMRLLYEIFQEKPVDRIVEGMNEEYRNVAWEYVKKKIPPWKVINNLYALGFNNLQ